VTHDAIIQTLSACPLFADLGRGAVERVADYFDVLEGAVGDRLYSEGDSVVGLYVVIEGELVAKVTGADGREHNIRTVRPGDVFGEMSLLLRGERLITIEATQPVRVLELSEASFSRMKREDADACLLVIMALVRRFGRALDGSREVLKRILLRYLAGVDGA